MKKSHGVQKITISGVLDPLPDSKYSLVCRFEGSGVKGKFVNRFFNGLPTGLLGVKIIRIFHCPHYPQGSVPAYAIDSDCLEPSPGMIERAARELGLSLPDSMLIGDKDSDISAARAAGVGHAYRVKSENPEPSTEPSNTGGQFASLLDCVEQLFPSNVQDLHT